MQAITFLQAVQQLDLPVFHLPDVARIIHKSREYARVYIHRLTQKRYVRGLERGKYTLLQDAEEIASHLVFPSYISFLSAYAIYGLTTQLPVRVQVATVKPRKPLQIDSTAVMFITLHKKKFFGYRRQAFRSSFIFLADKEKAIIDALALPEHCPIGESVEALSSPELNTSLLVEYALQMDSIVAIKRLGYLLERVQGVDVYEQVQHKLNLRYDPLNPFFPSSRENSPKWKLNINEVFKEAPP